MKTSFFLKFTLGVFLLISAIGSTLYWGSKGLGKYVLPASQTPNTATTVELSYNQIGETPLLGGDSLKQISTPANRYTIELGVAESLQDAETSIENLSREGHPAFFSPEQIDSGAVIYRIRMGLFTTQEEAIAGLSALGKTNSHKGKLVAL